MDEPLDTTIWIETPEHIQFRYRVAGPSRRALAYALDFSLRAVIGGVLAVLFGLGGASGFQLGAVLLMLFLLEWGYFVVCELATGGRSPGKRALDLRVVTLSGAPISFGDSVLRNLLRAADFLPSAYVFGLLAMLFDARFRRLGDLAAGTMVVYEKRQRLRPPIDVEPPKARELARLPERVDLASESVLAIEQFLRKVPDLSEQRAEELAEILAEPHAARLRLKYKSAVRFLEILHYVAVQGRTVQDREAFISSRSGAWRELEELLATRRSLSELRPADISRAAALYRSACADLMHARLIGCPADVIGFLDALTARAHSALYSSRSRAFATVRDLLLSRFPRAFRRQGWFMAASAALFLVPLAAGWVGAWMSPGFAQKVLPPHQLEALARAYAEGFSFGRSENLDAAMAGFYVENNIGIAFRCFATGILLGLGSIFFLLYNGLAIGTTFGYVVRAGAGANILTFGCGHAPFELTAIVIAGGAGLRLGFALVDTDGLTRLGSLRKHSLDLVALVSGAAVMLAIAALIEGFWSPSSMPAHFKYAFSAVGVAVMSAFLGFASREPEART
ncbi:MAG TPA: stage II sporulation protein M [Polyangiaceae bacterium]|nr:stage II sporulation protein M [Polyangiaceae bacterium]